MHAANLLRLCCGAVYFWTCIYTNSMLVCLCIQHLWALCSAALPEGRSAGELPEGIWPGVLRVRSMQHCPVQWRCGATVPAADLGACARAAQAYQKVVTGAVLLSMLVNLGTVLSVSACGVAATASFTGAGISAVLLLFNWLKARWHLRGVTCRRAETVSLSPAPGPVARSHGQTM